MQIVSTKYTLTYPGYKNIRNDWIFPFKTNRLGGSRNIAPLGRASQTSTGYGGNASRAIDGITDGNYFSENPSVTHTVSGGLGVWWKVTWDEDFYIDTVKIYNRYCHVIWVRLLNCYAAGYFIQKIAKMSDFLGHPPSDLGNETAPQGWLLPGPSGRSYHIGQQCDRWNCGPLTLGEYLHFLRFGKHLKRSLLR